MFKRFSNTRARAPCNPRRGAVFAPKWAKKFCKPALRQLAKFRVHSRSSVIKNRALVSFSALSRLFALIRPTPSAFYHPSRKLTTTHCKMSKNLWKRLLQQNKMCARNTVSWNLIYNMCCKMASSFCRVWNIYKLLDRNIAVLLQEWYKKSCSPLKNQQNRTAALLLHSTQPCYNKKSYAQKSIRFSHPK